MKLILNILLACALLSCHSGKEKSPKAHLPKTAAHEIRQHQKTASKPMPHQLMEFVKYNDDGDYFLVTAKKGDSLFTFINESDDRSLLRGDIYQERHKYR
ncbi:hypothetical protein QF042_003561 [Pedobacter sp. W3I1]|uniref:hypothetical protein n=1 Tax=Pedobacter sp. W3I1 TaxID=3042291 RepID=UPI00277D25DB|nr:hypothetical protein [Pedobacter sp. W3I1]MDQ0639996.1 hypothetical protein [Pedobacter sp. W3I1]